MNVRKQRIWTKKEQRVPLLITSWVRQSRLCNRAARKEETRLLWLTLFCSFLDSSSMEKHPDVFAKSSLEHFHWHFEACLGWGLVSEMSEEAFWGDPRRWNRVQASAGSTLMTGTLLNLIPDKVVFAFWCNMYLLQRKQHLWKLLPSHCTSSAW